jgi:hypothetical protein
MTITFGFTDELTNTRFAPLAALSAYYQQHQVLAPLADVQIPMKIREFSPADKLIQVLLSVLAGCATLSEVNATLKSENGLAALWGWARFADQSSLSRLLDALTLTNIDQLRQGTTAIWAPHSRTQAHDWRGFLWLDFDLSGLPCSPRAEASQKGYFSDKKTPLDGNWHGLAPSGIAKRSGRTSMPATAIPSSAFNRRSWPPKLL